MEGDKIVAWERESWIDKEPLGYNIFRALQFILPPRGWHRSNLKHLIIFTSFMPDWYRGTFPPRAGWASAQNDMTSRVTAYSHSQDWKLPSLYIFGHQCTLPFGITPMQFMWHFCCLLFTLRHRAYPVLKSTNTACQRSICNIRCSISSDFLAQ